MSTINALIKDASELYDEIVNKIDNFRRASKTTERAFRSILIDLRYNSLDPRTFKNRLHKIFEGATIMSRVGRRKPEIIKKFSDELVTITWNKISKYYQNKELLRQFLEFYIMQIRIKELMQNSSVKARKIKNKRFNQYKRRRY